MTKQEYLDYEASIERFFQREGLNDLCVIYPNDDEPLEPYFSWRSCEVCCRPLGGTRVDMEGYNTSTKEIQGPYSVCEDCVNYIEYGQLDDMTMLDMEE